MNLKHMPNNFTVNLCQIDEFENDCTQCILGIGQRWSEPQTIVAVVDGVAYLFQTYTFVISITKADNEVQA